MADTRCPHEGAVAENSMGQQAGGLSVPHELFAGRERDPRWRMVNRTMRLSGHQADALIETLHAVQDSFGYVDRDAMQYVAHALRVPLSRVYSVATFYHYFSLKPPGKHTCVVCLGTACYIGGSSAILENIHEKLGINPGETTADGKVSLLIARCLGSCGLAPAAVLDGQVTGKLSSDMVLDTIRSWTGHDSDA
jgi:bidirectional [NiFe] hydrogenase diaphorase subunit